MTSETVVRPGAPGAGPVVWLGIIASTCLLLFLLQKVLWLVVPFLLALILYYALQPALQWLIYRGFGREMAAAWVILAFVAISTLSGVALLPWLASHLADGQATALRYLQGGLQLLDHLLRSLEAQWPTLARAHLADAVTTQLETVTERIPEHLQGLAIGVMTWLPSFFLVPFLAYFFLRDGRRFKHFLGRAVPNAFFEKTLYLLHEVDRTARAYFQGLARLTVLDTVTLAFGLWLLGLPAPLALGLICAVLAWVPYVGSILGGFLVMLVAATDFPDAPHVAYWTIALFVLVRLLDDFVYMPLTVGKSLELHPLVTVLMIFVGGAVAGISGLMLVLPVLGVVMVVGETLGAVLTDVRLLARHRHARALRRAWASLDL